MTAALAALTALAERERNAAMFEAKRLEIEHRNAQRQAEQLLAYRADYELRWSRGFADAGGAIAIVHCYQGFMARLEGAIDAQQRLVAIAAQRLADAQAQWQQQETRVAAIRKLQERRGAQQRSADTRHEQRLQDEHGLHAAWKRRDAAVAPRSSDAR